MRFLISAISIAVMVVACGGGGGSGGSINNELKRQRFILACSKQPGKKIRNG